MTLLAAWLSAGVAQTQTAPPQATLHVNSSLVYVPALVRDGAGSLVYNLTADDFTLTDDGVPQKITLKPDNGGDPLALVLGNKALSVEARTTYWADSAAAQ